MDKIRALISEELNILENSYLGLINDDNTVFSELNNFLMNGSKRIRSVLALLYLKAYGCSLDKDIIKVIQTAELIHNASLLHDDVVDSSEVRRSKITMYKKFGSKLAVLSGDYLISIAVSELLKLGNIEILNIYLEAVKSMSNAEIIQFINRNADITPDDYINISKGKTASLFSAILQSVAVLKNLDVKIACTLGLNFGILFQINNDFMHESIINDARNGVQTVKNILGIEKTLALKDNYREEIRRVIVGIPENNYKQGIEDLIKLL